MKRILIFLLLPILIYAQPKKALVAGGAGFLGSHLCDRLIQDGYEVLCVDNLYTGRRENIIHLIGNLRFTFFEHDITTPLPDDLKPDEIYNLACPASPVHYQKSPVKTLRTSVLGMMNLLDLACRCQAKIFQSSTSEVYGDPLEHPQKETYWGHVNPIGLRSCYDEGKRCAEALCFDYRREFHVSIKVARIFNTYGPRMRADDGRVVSNFIVQALNEKPITIYGKGEQTRSFCYVDDLIEGIVRLMQTPDDITGPVNLGNPSEWTMLELAQKIIALTNSSSTLTYLPLPPDDPKMRLPDISLAKNILAWAPNVPVDDGLKSTIDSFRKNLLNTK